MKLPGKIISEKLTYECSNPVRLNSIDFNLILNLERRFFDLVNIDPIPINREFSHLQDTEKELLQIQIKDAKVQLRSAQLKLSKLEEDYETL